MNGRSEMAADQLSFSDVASPAMVVASEAPERTFAPGHSVLAPARHTDPQSSHDAAASVDGNKQMCAILTALWTAEVVSGFPASVTACSPVLGRLMPGVERGSWSARLAAMTKPKYGLLFRAGLAPGRYGRGVIAFQLTASGRAAAEALTRSEAS